MHRIIFGKKAQVGKLLTGLVVFFLVVVIMAAFVAFSFVLTKKNALKEAESNSFLGDNSIFRKTIELDIKGQKQKMLVLDGLMMFKEGKVNYFVLEGALKKLVSSADSCLIISMGDKEKPAGRLKMGLMSDFYIYFDKEAKSGYVFFSAILDYHNKGLLRTGELSFFEEGKPKILYLEYYYGKCFSEVKNE